MDAFKETMEFVEDALKANTDGFLVIAYRGEDGAVAVYSEDKSEDKELLPFAISRAMARNDEFSQLLLKAITMFAVDKGNVMEFDIPDDASLN